MLFFDSNGRTRARLRSRGGPSARALAAALAGLLSLPAPACAQELSVRSFWVKEGPPGAEVLAGFLDIENASDRPRRLVGLSTPDAGRVMIHRTEIRDGVAHMRPVEALEIPAHGHAVLEPGGAHLMIMQPRRPLRDGDSVSFELLFDGGERLETEAPVRASAPSAAR